MNGKEKIIDCLVVNDGSWYYIVIIWISVDGVWKVYIDGKLFDGGVGFFVGSVIFGMF